MDKNVRYAGFWIRILAGIVDLIVLSLLYSCFIGIATFMGIVATEHLQAMVIIGVFSVSFSFVLDLLYFSIFLSSSWQATIGMRLFGLKITGYDYKRISFGLALIRELCTILSAMILYIGFLMIAFTKKKQGLHDLIANTYVIRK